MRKFAVVPAIVAGILFLYANSASAGGTSNTIGNFTYHSFGGTTGMSQRLGNFTFHSGPLFGD